MLRFLQITAYTCATISTLLLLAGFGALAHDLILGIEVTAPNALAWVIVQGIAMVCAAIFITAGMNYGMDIEARRYGVDR